VGDGDKDRKQLDQGNEEDTHECASCISGTKTGIQREREALATILTSSPSYSPLHLDALGYAVQSLLQVIVLQEKIFILETCTQQICQNKWKKKD
jgi:hypothetical protein